uniref:Apple domain-containing protein n=1 Tax=Meloidogyne enterolobii TaxID=390850 RepID=A0A6V7VL36_MELEN|nr:unnamed protein product [Meloidogyne enterolobii]
MILLPFLLFFLSGISAETHKFHHCFDRYNNHKIIGGRFIIQPFHSEWRIGGGEARCIDFCIRSLSRCASIVFDKHEHICHYFSIGGLDNVVPEKGFVYLSLISKECIVGSDNEVVTNDEKIQKQIPVDLEAEASKIRSNTNTTTITATTTPTTTITSPPPSPPTPIIVTPKKDKENKTNQSTEPLMERKQQISNFSNQEVEQFLLNEEHFTTITTTEKPLEEAETEDSISFLEEIDRELREKEEENLEESEEELEARLKEEQNLIIIPTLSMLKIKKRIKNEEEELKEIRRHPRLDNSINNKNNRVDNYLIKQQNRVGKINKLKEENEGCGTGKQAIWIAVENARFNPSSIDHFSPTTNHDTNSQTTTSFTTETPKECAKFCSNTTTTFFDNFGRRRRCNAFSLMKMKNYVNLPIQMLSFHQC